MTTLSERKALRTNDVRSGSADRAEQRSVELMRERYNRLEARYRDSAAVIELLMAERDEAERRATEYATALRARDKTLVWRVGGVFRRFGRRFPSLAGRVHNQLRKVIALLRGRYTAYKESIKAEQALIDEDRAVITASGLFEAEWYLAANGDLAGHCTVDTAIDHYLRYGSGEGRRPNPDFDPLWYSAAYPEVAAMRRDPLAHYILRGAPLGHKPNPAFDAGWYVQNYAVDTSEYATPLRHYRIHSASPDIATEPAQLALKRIGDL